jgi:hypothetical protein
MIRLNYHYLLSLLLCLLSTLCVGQRVYDGQAINKTTGEPIPAATVRLLKENVATQTNDKGYFTLTSEIKIANDTLIFSSVGFNTYRLPVSSYQKSLAVILAPSNTALSQVNIGSNKVKTTFLEHFGYREINDVHGIHGGYENLTFPYTTRNALAKLFEAPQPNVRLTEIQLGRRDYENEWYGQWPHTTSNRLTRFLVRILAVDTITNSPGTILYTKEVSLKDKALIVTLDVTDENIRLPTAKFFISVEWLRIPYNEIVSLSMDSVIYKKRTFREDINLNVSKYYVFYQPILVSYPKFKPAQKWIRNDRGLWDRLNKPGQDIALSATIRY